MVSAERQTFVRECQRIDHGKIIGLVVRDAEPIFVESTEVLIDFKLDADESLRPEQRLLDYVLPAELVRLFCKLDAIREGLIEHVEVRTGIPRRIIVRDSGATRK